MGMQLPLDCLSLAGEFGIVLAAKAEGQCSGVGVRRPRLVLRLFWPELGWKQVVKCALASLIGGRDSAGEFGSSSHVHASGQT